MLPKYITHSGKKFPIKTHIQPFHTEKTQLRVTLVCLNINQRLRSYSFIKLLFIVQNGWSYFGSLRIHSTSATLASSLCASQYGLVKSVLLDLRNKDQ